MLNEIGLGGRRREDTVPQSMGATDLVITEIRCGESELTEIKIWVQGQKRYRMIKLVLIFQYLAYSISSLGTGRLALLYASRVLVGVSTVLAKVPHPLEPRFPYM